MDTATKMFYIASKDKDFLPILSVMSDVMLGKMDKETVETANVIEKSFPELWNENQWLRMIGGTNTSNLNSEWNQYIREEIESEFSEKF